MTHTNAKENTPVGIGQTKDAVKFLIEIGEAVDKPSIPEIGEALAAAIPAIKGYRDIPDELRDLDEAEKEELVKFVQDELSLTRPRAEEIAEKAVKIVIMIGDLVYDMLK